MAHPQAQQQQYPIPQQQRPFSPQNTSMPMAQQSANFMPPQKRPRLSPDPSSSQPSPPYNPSPYQNTNAMRSNGSPHYNTSVALPQNPQYNTPYGNGSISPSPLNMPQTHSTYNNQAPHNQHGQLSYPPHVSQQQQQFQHPGNYSQMMPQHQQHAHGVMAPPAKPGKNNDLNPMDVLGGTDVDLEEEDNLNRQMSSRSFSQFPPGSRKSFFGAGPANQEPDSTELTPEELAAKLADEAWQRAARSLADTRTKELQRPFLVVANIHQRAERIARENGLTLRTVPTNDGSVKMGHMKLPGDFAQPKVTISTKAGPEGAMLQTYGVFIPHDSLLVDQLALLSIAARQRLGTLIADASKLAKGRQTTSHGIVPPTWADIAIEKGVSGLVVEGAPRSGWESAVSPRTNPLKRSHSASNGMPTPTSDDARTPAGPQLKSTVTIALRSIAQSDRDAEEARRAKRLARAAGGDVGSRQGSLVPGTPGSVAPSVFDKPPTKKEQKKAQQAKVTESTTHAAANQTTAQFLGRGLKKKKYSWMDAPSGGSGASTPGRINTTGLSGSSVEKPQVERLTADGARRIGQWREDREKGLHIQLRDWVTVLEEDGKEKKVLQKAYLALDSADPK